MSRRPITILAAAALAVAAGCATRDGAHDYKSEDVRAIQTVSHGTVESVLAVQINQDDAPVGTIAGAALGSLLKGSCGARIERI
jgi:outer membrane lipoprotein SlyB